MSEIEKMYENAGFIQKRCKDYSCIVCDKNKDCDKYPHFTAEKQIELIKLLAKRPLTIDNTDGEFEFDTACKVSRFGSFEVSLAEIINKHWQDLTEAEKQQVKGILE